MLSKKKKKKKKNRKTVHKKKSRNFLSNILFLGITKEDFYNQSFVLDVYTLVTKNLNPFL